LLASDSETYRAFEEALKSTASFEATDRVVERVVAITEQSVRAISAA
jgi:hypothetical protein